MAGIYIHIPFCKQKCTYCDFHFSTSFDAYRSKMVEAICTELKLRQDYLGKESIETIYFGGGTPSLLTTDELKAILDVVRHSFAIVSDAEITLEANPDDISEATAEAWMQLGINRVSVGIQSFREEDLQWMNRAHTVSEAKACVQQLQSSGITNLTVDLIYGLPGLGIEQWERHIRTVVEMGVQHVSAYCLTVEERTVLDQWVRHGKIVPASEQQQAEQFLSLCRLLEEAGYEQYEVSNFARPGFRARHNSAYWKGINYLGIGPSAHSFNGHSRAWNVRNNTSYMRFIEEGKNWMEIEELSVYDRFNELLMTGLRTSDGVSLEELTAICRIPDEFWITLKSAADKDWLLNDGKTIRLTREGRLRADRIASDLFQIKP